MTVGDRFVDDQREARISSSPRLEPEPVRKRLKRVTAVA